MVPLSRSLFLVVVAISLLADIATGQFLRIGPFDFEAEGFVEGVYSSNIEEEERTADPEAEREDYYSVTGVELSGNARMAPNTELQIDAGMAVEKHVNRPDLDNEEEPFTSFGFSSSTRLGPILLDADASYERTSESTDNEFDPQNRKRRKISNESVMGLNATYEMRILTLEGGYEFERTRYDDEDFVDSDEDAETITAGVTLQPWDRLSMSYEYEKEKTDLINDDESTPWSITENVAIDFDLPLKLYGRDVFKYSLGIEKEDIEGEEEGEWEVTHTVGIGDELPLIETSTFMLSVDAAYQFERDQEEDDIEFSYGVFVEHQLARTAYHSLSATRQPVDTLGSTEDTDETEISYSFTKEDLFIYNLNLSLQVTYTHSDPLEEQDPALDEPVVFDDDVEKSWEYNVSLEHNRTISRRLEQTFGYIYSYEDSNFTDPTEVHELRLSYTYRF